MKYLKKKEKKRWPVIVGMVIGVAALLAAIAVLMPGKTTDIPLEPTAAATDAATLPAETEPLYEAPVVTEPVPLLEPVNGRIQTPYGPLYYPEELSEHLLVANTSEEPYTLEFYAAMENKQEMLLFAVSFGETSGGNMGLVNTDLGEVPLNVVIYNLTPDETWTQSEIVTAQAMQDAINGMLDQLLPENAQTKSEDFEVAEQPEQMDTVHNLAIETPFCTLYYPAWWGNALRYECDDTQEIYKVHFYGKPEGGEVQLLFSVYFGGDDGYQLGAVLSQEGVPTPVNLLMNQLELEGLDEADENLLCEMQEASNQLIEKLPLLK